jgi:hypothetical protein
MACELIDGDVLESLKRDLERTERRARGATVNPFGRLRPWRRYFRSIKANCPPKEFFGLMVSGAAFKDKNSQDKRAPE